VTSNDNNRWTLAEALAAKVACNAMPETTLTDQLAAFRAWKASRRRLLQQLQPWLRQQGLYTAEARHAIDHALWALQDDQLRVAVAGEFWRGKTELINALFFADHGGRLLPAEAWRTTMCPTEIFCDLDTPPHLRLLPIETRGQEHSLSALRDDPSQWETFDLELGDPEGLCQHLHLLTEHKEVTKREAAELGLFVEQDDGDADRISIPRWRLALINIHHPLLAQGLRVLDTPGLNAIGSEPELTYEMLPAAHAILLVLAADTGVTQSDMQVWQRFIERPGRAGRLGVMVILSKTDTLWDGLRSPRQVAESITKQCRDVAQTVGISAKQVFAVSAQEALVARVQQDTRLERHSGITSLERYLGDAMLDNRMDLIQHEYTSTVQRAIGTLESLIRGRLARSEQQRSSLSDLAGKSDAAIAAALHNTQCDHDRYQATVDAYKHGLAAFKRHNHTLMAALDVHALDQVLDRIRDTMTGAWTTSGLREAMRTLFQDIDSRIEIAGKQTQSMRRLVRTIYRRFQGEHDIRLLTPQMFSIVKHQVELSLLDQEAEIFRNSARTTLMEQHFVTKRYFRTIVTRAQRIIRQAHDEARDWTDNALLPLATEIKEHRDILAQRVEDLRQTGESRKTIQQRIDALTRDTARLRARLAALHKVQELLGDQRPVRPARASGQN
jgi:hypothetical protein